MPDVNWFNIKVNYKVSLITKTCLTTELYKHKVASDWNIKLNVMFRGDVDPWIVTWLVKFAGARAVSWLESSPGSKKSRENTSRYSDTLDITCHFQHKFHILRHITFILQDKPEGNQYKECIWLKRLEFQVVKPQRVGLEQELQISI